MGAIKIKIPWNVSSLLHFIKVILMHRLKKYIWEISLYPDDMQTLIQL